MFFKNLCVLGLWAKVASALEGLNIKLIEKVSMGLLKCGHIRGVHCNITMRQMYM